MKRFIAILVSAAFLAMAMPTVNFDDCDGEISFCKEAAAKSKKTVSVRSYKTKKGKTVRAHKRRAPRR